MNKKLLLLIAMFGIVTSDVLIGGHGSSCASSCDSPACDEDCDGDENDGADVDPSGGDDCAASTMSAAPQGDDADDSMSDAGDGDGDQDPLSDDDSEEEPADDYDGEDEE